MILSRRFSKHFEEHVKENVEEQEEHVQKYNEDYLKLLAVQTNNLTITTLFTGSGREIFDTFTKHFSLNYDGSSLLCRHVFEMSMSLPDKRCSAGRQGVGGLVL